MPTRSTWAWSLPRRPLQGHCDIRKSHISTTGPLFANWDAAYNADCALVRDLYDQIGTVIDRMLKRGDEHGTFANWIERSGRKNVR